MGPHSSATNGRHQLDSGWPKNRSRKLSDACPGAVADRESPEDDDEEEEAGKRSRKGRERMAKRGPIRFASGFSLLIHLSPVPQHPAAGLGSPSVLTGTQTKLRTRRKVNRSAAPSRGALVNLFSFDNQVLIFTLLFNGQSYGVVSAIGHVSLLNFFFIHFFRRFWIFLSEIVLLSKIAKGDREELAGAVAFGTHVTDKLAPILAGFT